jgi:hypothetical protein
MEEKNGTLETQEVKMISVEQANTQMQSVVQQYNSKLQQIVAQAQQLDAMLRDRTLDHLFKVIKYSNMFNEDFVTKCTDAVEKYLTQVALTEPEQEETVPGITPVIE